VQGGNCRRARPCNSISLTEAGPPCTRKLSWGKSLSKKPVVWEGLPTCFPAVTLRVKRRWKRAPPTARKDRGENVESPRRIDLGGSASNVKLTSLSRERRPVPDDSGGGNWDFLVRSSVRTSVLRGSQTVTSIVSEKVVEQGVVAERRSLLRRKNGARGPGGSGKKGKEWSRKKGRSYGDSGLRPTGEKRRARERMH